MGNLRRDWDNLPRDLQRHILSMRTESMRQDDAIRQRLKRAFLDVLCGSDGKEYDTFDQVEAAAAKLDVEFGTKNLSRKFDFMSGYHFHSFVFGLGLVHDPGIYE